MANGDTDKPNRPGSDNTEDLRKKMLLDNTLTLDESAVEQYGQWPWPRDVLADVVWKLREQGAGIIVMPILFS